MIRTRSAIVPEPGEKWRNVERELRTPDPNPALARWENVGWRHTEDHFRRFDDRYPIVGGHEYSYSGDVEAVDPGMRFAVGDGVAVGVLRVRGFVR